MPQGKSNARVCLLVQNDLQRRTRNQLRRNKMRSILLLLLGVPLPIIILIGLFSHF